MTPPAMNGTSRASSGIIWNSSASLVVRLLSALCGFLVIALVTRLLAPEDAGRYFMLYSFCSIVAVVIGCGLNLTSVQQVSEAIALKSPERVKSTIYTSLTILALSTFIFATLLPLRSVGDALTHVLMTDVDWVVLLLIFVWTVGLALQSTIGEVFRGMHDIQRAAFYGFLCNGVLCLAALAGAFVLSVHSLRAVSGLTAAAALLAAGVASASLHRFTGTMSGRGKLSLRTTMKMSLPFWGTNLVLVLLTQADIWMLNHLSNGTDVALYGAASRLTQMLTLPLLVLNSALIPVISEHHALGQRERLQDLLRGSATMAAVPAFIALIAFALAGGWILQAAFGEAYREAHLILLVLAVGQCVNVLCGSAGYVLLMTGRQRDMFFITAVSGAAMCLLAWVLGSKFGALGVAIGSAMGLATQSLMMCWTVWRCLGMVTFASPSAMLHPFRTLRVLS